MNDVSVGAVGAAVIAGLVSLLGLVISKEQKISEFRQAWINDLRSCLVSYVVSINSISDMLRIRSSSSKIDSDILASLYRDLNNASHGITLRINETESESKNLRLAMDEFELLAGQNSTLTPDHIKNAERQFIDASRRLLKYEWDRVRKGEKTYVLTRRITIAATAILALLLLSLWTVRISKGAGSNVSRAGTPNIVQTTNLDLSFPSEAAGGLARSEAAGVSNDLSSQRSSTEGHKQGSSGSSNRAGSVPR